MSVNISKLISFFFYSIVFFVPLIFIRRIEDTFSLPKIDLLMILLTVIFGFFFFEIFFKKKPFSLFKNCPWFLNLAILLFCLQTLLAIFFSINPEVSFWGYHKRWEGFVTWIAYFGLFYIALYLVKSSKDKSRHISQSNQIFDQINKTEKIFFFAIIAALISFFYAFLQYFNLDPFSWGTDFGSKRVFSTLANPTFLGGYMAIVFPLALYFYFSKKGFFGRHQIFFGLAGLMIFSTVLFCQTRGGFLGLLGGMIVFFLLGGINFFWQNKKKFSVLFILLLILLIFFGGNISERLKEIFAFSENSKVLQEDSKEKGISTFFAGSAKERIYIWEKTLKIIKDYPLFGIGPDNLRFILNNYERLTDNQFHSYTTVDRVHNDLLEMAVSRGIPGLIFYLSILVSLGCIFWKVFQKHLKTQSTRLFFAALVSGMLAYLIQNQFAFSTVALSFLFWILAGCLVGFCKSNQDENANKDIHKNKALIRLYKNLLGFIFFLSFLFFSFYFLKTTLADFYCKTGLLEGMFKKDFKKETSFHRKALSLRPNFHFYQERLVISLFNDFPSKKPISFPSKFSLEQEEKEKEKRISHLKELIKEIEKLISLSPKSGFYYRPLGLAYFQLAQEENLEENLKKAKEVIEKTIELNPTLAFSYSDLAKVYFKEEKEEKSKELFAKALEIKKKSFDSNIALESIIAPIFEVAKYYFDQGENEKAISLLKEILKRYPDHLSSRRNLGVIYYTMNELEKAKEEFEKVIKINPQDEEIKKVLEGMKK